MMLLMDHSMMMSTQLLQYLLTIQIYLLRNTQHPTILFFRKKNPQVIVLGEANLAHAVLRTIGRDQEEGEILEVLNLLTTVLSLCLAGASFL